LPLADIADIELSVQRPEMVAAPYKPDTPDKQENRK
jgi:hypothetical protein